MFAGSDNGGHTAASIYSLIETAKMNNLNPHLYMQKVLATIQDYMLCAKHTSPLKKNLRQAY